MIGSIIGDIVGSTYEFANIRTKDFPLFTKDKEFTDDSILTIATADWLMHGGKVEDYYLRYAKKYPNPMGAYGSGFVSWVYGDHKPYYSCGNGSAMRVGPVGWVCKSEADAFSIAKETAECTHNHPEGIKGAQVIALSIFLAKKGASKKEIKELVNLYYDLNFTCDEIRDSYQWGGTCQTSVPHAIVAFLDGNDFEDCIRNAISIGGDSDTIGCITGSIAEAFYGIPKEIYDKGMSYLPTELKTVVGDFEARYGNKII